MHPNVERVAAAAGDCEVGQIVIWLVFLLHRDPVVALVSGSNRLDEARQAAAGTPQHVFPISPGDLVQASNGGVGALRVD